MIALKKYQNRVLESLREFFRETSRTGNPDSAFEAVQRLKARQSTPYLSVNRLGLADGMPYVCLKVPTGGGKTLLACYACGSAKSDLLHVEHAVVLWLVPSNTILTQTADALRDVRHPYRMALEVACGPVEVLTINEALRVPRAVVAGQTVIIVSTIQAFRVEDTTGRKVYEQNSAFQEHMSLVPSDRLSDMLTGADGKPKPSLVNMLRLRRPIVIVDEAHNARTDLSFVTLGNVLPSCIIEFTATPDRTSHPSNILHRVSAAELKAADMVKLPLRVFVREKSQKDELLADALTLRHDLEKLANSEGQRTGEYLRPMMLIQAETVDSCEPLRTRLVNEYGLDASKVKISTGKLDELENIKDISSQTCPVRVIITVQKLREGWDCPFAYVLCSLKETRSSTAIEQIVGRILRLPQARQKMHAELNCSYAFSVSPAIAEVVSELRDALEGNGFTRPEADRLVLPVGQQVLPLGVQPQTETFKPSEIDPEIAQGINEALNGKAVVDPAAGTVTVFVPMDEKDVETLSACVAGPLDRKRIVDLAAKVTKAEREFGGTGLPHDPTPFQLGKSFRVPILCFTEDGNLFEFERTFLLEHPWKLSAKDASLRDAYNPTLRPGAHSGLLDVGEKGEVQSEIIKEIPVNFIDTLHQQALSLSAHEEWSVEKLVAWLDRNIAHQDIPSGESAEYLRKVVRGLITQFNTDISTLALDRFRLRDEVEKRIDQHRKEARKTAFNQLLFPESSLIVSESQSIDFSKKQYEPTNQYDGNHKFKKHFYGHRPGDLEAKTAAGKPTEEFLCAAYLDELDEVEFWVRNLAKRDSSFRLQTSTDWFYPDFLCKLKDERLLAVEYKGGYLYDGIDAEEKRAIGAVWESRSEGKCLFVMPTAGDLEVIRQKISQS